MPLYDLSSENISLLLTGRDICETCKNEDDKRFKLAGLGFASVFKFEYFNMVLNIAEVDGCFRLRHVDKPLYDDKNRMEIDDFCVNSSGCKKRNITPCAVDSEFIRCYNRHPLIIDGFPISESEIYNEYQGVAADVGVDLDYLFLPHPLFFIGNSSVSPETWMPPHCEGIIIKIEEPRFDVLWGTNYFQSFGELEWKFREMEMNGL